jgi:hypothetical protein
MKLAHTADIVARDLYQRPIPDTPFDWLIRDACDGATGGELSCALLDRLTDMVRLRLFSDRWQWQKWRLDQMKEPRP